MKKSENVPKKVGGGFESVSTVRLLTATTLCGGKGNNYSYSSGVYINMLSVRIFFLDVLRRAFSVLLLDATGIR